MVGKLSLALGLVLLCTPASFSKEPVRSFELIYEVQLPALPPDAREVKVWVPLAASDDAVQTIRAREIRAAHPYQITRDSQYGNDILFLDLKEPLPPALDLAVRYEAEVRERRPEIEKAPPEIPESLRQTMLLHLESNKLMVVNEEIRELAREVTAGAATPSQKAEKIYEHVISKMRYDKETPGWGNGDTLRACEIGAGNCTDFHSLFISLARASGIPARFQIGIPVPDKKEGEIPGYHCWAQFYLPEAGWIPVDASEAWQNRKKEEYFFGTHDPNRLTVSTGRDIRLVPAPSDSEELNYFFFPYVEVDGKALAKDQIRTKFHFKDLAKI